MLLSFFTRVVPRTVFTWFEIMSGPLSVVFALKGGEWSSWLAYACLWATLISIAVRRHRLEERQKPRLRMFFDPSYEGCIKPGPFGLLYRIGVTTTGTEHIEKCQGFLTKIEE